MSDDAPPPADGAGRTARSGGAPDALLSAAVDAIFTEAMGEAITTELTGEPEPTLVSVTPEGFILNIGVPFLGLLARLFHTTAEYLHDDHGLVTPTAAARDPEDLEAAVDASLLALDVAARQMEPLRIAFQQMRTADAPFTEPVAVAIIQATALVRAHLAARGLSDIFPTLAGDEAGEVFAMVTVVLATLQSELVTALG